MATWAPGTIVMDKGLGGGRRTSKINGAIPHVAAARGALDFVANPNSRDNHPTYYIDLEGNLYGIVHPDRRPWTTSHDVDEEAVTFEIANPNGDQHPYPITEASLATLKRTLLHHAREEGYSAFVLNQRGQDQTRQGFFIGGHRQYHQVACPGDWLWSRWPGIIQELNAALAGRESAPATPAPSTPASAQITGWDYSGGIAVPRGPLMARIQAALKRRGRYGGDVDGVAGPLTLKGVQQTVKMGGGYTGYVDGVLGPLSGHAIQEYARRHGDYTGWIDGDPREQSWMGFALGLERP